MKNNHFFDGMLLLMLSFLFTQFTLGLTTVAAFLVPVIVFGSFLYLLVPMITTDDKKIFRLKMAVLIGIFIISFVKSFSAAIKMRYLHPDTYPVSDNVVQIEQAARYLYQGKNPYSETYVGLGMEKYWPDNPAVYHVVTMPFYSILSAIVLFPVRLMGGYFDLRLVHILIFLPVLWLMFKSARHDEKFLTFLILFLFNPFFIIFFISGRSDVFVYSLLFYAFYLLRAKKMRWASLFFGLAVVSKQSSWMLFPLYEAYLYYQGRGNWWNKLKWVFSQSLPLFLAVVAFTVPFLLWDAKGFINGIYNYPAGNLQTSFPIAGFGFSGILRETFILKQTAYFPSWIFQLVFGLPVLGLLIRYLKKNLSVSMLITTYTIFLFIFWFFSRFFLDNYIGFLIMLLLTAWLFQLGETNRKPVGHD